MKQILLKVVVIVAYLSITGTVIANDDKPSAPVLISPSTAVTNPATFSWNSVNSATWYYLWINKGSSIAYRKWYEAANVCTSGTCSTPIDEDLTGGDHTFWVKAWNENGSTWSTGMNFSVSIGDSPVAATPLTPNSALENPVTYTWSEISTATWYKLYIWNDNQVKQYSDWYESSSICSSGSCSVNDVPDLAIGGYEWFLKTWNSSGPGPWSSGQAFSVTNGSATATQGEYGDAPDGTSTGYPAVFTQTASFPTLFASNGARTLKADDAILGTTASVETDANDPADPDGVSNLNTANTDTDDAITNLFLNLVSIPPPATLSVNVTGIDTGTGGTYYLNTLIDLDMDGSWGGTASGGEPEWVIKNHAVTITPGETASISPPAFAYGNGLQLPNGTWMRIALTKESISATDWDGSGEFSSGEIEDHVITLPQIDGKDHPILIADCGGPYIYNGTGFPPVTCNVTNLRTVAGTFDWTIAKISGGVDVQARSGGPIAIAAGPGATVAVGLTATKVGSLPSTWKFTAVPDPEAIISDQGVVIGHGESAVEVEFDGEEPANLFVDVIEGGFQHFDGFSEVKAFIHINTDNPDIIEGAEVTVELLRDGQSLESKIVTTDAFGNTNVDFTIFNFGNYTVRVIQIERDNGIYNPELNILDSVNVNVN